MKTLPKFLKQYFWDVDFNKINFNKSKIFILKRILEFGNEKAAIWMKRQYTITEIEFALSTYRIEPKSANFWACIFNIDRSKVKCLQKPYLKIRKKLWPY